MTAAKRVIVGISGASGTAIGVRVVERLAAIAGVETHLLVSRAGRRTLVHEVGSDAMGRLEQLVHRLHPIDDIGASLASGSFPTAGMVVAPCSMRTLSAISNGLSDNLLVRAAEVQLKERRRLVLLPRETPLHLGHLRAMCAATEMGAIIAPPVPAFYLRPGSVTAMIDQMAARAIDLLDLGIAPEAEAWTGAPIPSAPAAHR